MSHSPVASEVIRTASSARAMGLYLAVATGAGLLDWVTKLLAVTFLPNNAVTLGDRFALLLIFNKGGAGGVSWGPYTTLINVCVTAFAVLMITVIVRHLAKIDRRATWALGLVAGGAAGNLVSMLAGAEGVADFLAFRFAEGAVVANVADLALWGGAMLLIPVVGNLVRAIRAERAAKEEGMELVRV
ncbi:MAG: signal peptidase II [Phycisphaerae bacterium]|nr:signal peptidase II [Gemmatimonadaceae bacterium]